MIIAIDGHAGSGKTTISKILAKRLTMLHVNTGAMYRAATFFCINNDISPNNSIELSNSILNMDIDMQFDGSIYLNGSEITDLINGANVTNQVSYYSAIPELRETMVILQRKIVSNHDAVVEGRDIASTVFPCADLKFFFTANVLTRAKRRREDFLINGVDISIDELVSDINERDYIDSNRKASPLKVSDESIIVDTTDTSIEDQVNKLIKIVNNKRENLYGEF